MKKRTSFFIDFMKIKEIFDKNPLLISILVIAIIFLLFSGILFDDDKPTVNITENTIDVKQFTNETEVKLKKILEMIDGVGKCEVMITVETGIEYIYETEQRVDNNKVINTDSNYQKNEEILNEEERPVIVNNADGGERALIRKELQPRIQGIAVICDGGASALIKNRVIDTVTTLLNLSSDKVCVTVKK